MPSSALMFASTVESQEQGRRREQMGQADAFETDCWMRSPGTVNAGQSWSYNSPARPGDVITLQARALDKFIKRERLFVVHDNVFFNQHGEVICSGRGWTIRPQ